MQVNKSVMIIIIRALSQWGKDDGDYDSPTSRDETPDENKKIKEAKEAQIKKRKEAIKKEKAPKKEKKREGTMLLSFYHTCASK